MARADGLLAIIRCLEAQQQANADAVIRLKVVADVKAADIREATQPLCEAAPAVSSE